MQTIKNNYVIRLINFLLKLKMSRYYIHMLEKLEKTSKIFTSNNE